MDQLYFLLVVAFLWSLVHSQQRQQSSGSSNQAGASCSRNYQFDQLVLAIQWPSSFCYEKADDCNLQAARTRKWLIHGLWPSRTVQRPGQRPKRNGNAEPRRNGFSDIAFCCGPSYNSTALNQTLYQQLLDKWPTLNANGKHHSFWNHEWRKHGTCARTVDALKTQQQYFTAILGLYNRFDLNRARLQSNQSYPLETLHREIDPLVGGKKVRIECSLANNRTATSSASNRTSIFSEVHICLDKTLQPIDCVRGDDHQCRRRVLFP